MEPTNPTPPQTPLEDVAENIDALRDTMTTINREVDDPLQKAHEARIAALRAQAAEQSGAEAVTPSAPPENTSKGSETSIPGTSN